MYYGERLNSISHLVGATLALVFYGTTALAVNPSVELGEKMFNNPGLGASQNAISCNTCHPKGDGMAKAAANPQLTAVINKCIKGPLKGEALTEDTVAMKSLVLYIKSLAD